MSKASRTVIALLALSPSVVPVPSAAQDVDARATVLAVTDSALDAINRGDMVLLADLMIPEAFTMAIRDSIRYGVRRRDDVRAQQLSGIVERGFRPSVHIAGPLAVVWLPYDLYVNGQWSHCGVDAFTLVKTGAAWRIAVLAWSIEQPPACDRHPDGPPPPSS